MSHLLEELEEIKEAAVETFTEEELISHGHHPRLAHIVLMLRNLAVLIAAVLFIVSIILHNSRYIFKSIAYFFGGAAYILEYLLLTDFLKEKVPHHELFMVYCLGPLYFLLGLSYIFQ
jgi:hypothetical protein